ncbi:unnamed protein product [Amaranthus hypochondriacus]
MYEIREQTPQTQISDPSYPYLPSTFPNYYAPPPPPHPHPHPHFFDSNPKYGVYPSNSTVIAAQPINYSDSNVDSSNWVIKESEPVKYTPLQAIQPLKKEANASTSYKVPQWYNSTNRKMVNKICKKKGKSLKVNPNKLSGNQNIRCELCKIECCDVQMYAKHLSGKKHAKSLRQHYGSTIQSTPTVSVGGQGIPGASHNPTDLEVKKKKLLESGVAIQSMKICAICNVACNGEVVFAKHVAGKKHLAKERAISTAGNPISVSGKSTQDTTNAQANQTKKRKNEEPEMQWCAVCKISCTSIDGLNAHLVGKKHQKNFQKLQPSNSQSVTPPPNINAATPVPTASPLPSTDLSIQVEGNTIAAETSQPETQQTKKKSKVAKDVETKKQNVLQCGAAADALRTCTTCNVVCNSDIVFKTHLAGQKHAAMMKKTEAEAEAARKGLQAVYPVT